MPQLRPCVFMLCTGTTFLTLDRSACIHTHIHVKETGTINAGRKEVVTVNKRTRRGAVAKEPLSFLSPVVMADLFQSNSVPRVKRRDLRL